MRGRDPLVYPQWWDELSDDELRSRLMNRAMSAAELERVDLMVEERESGRDARILIGEILGEE